MGKSVSRRDAVGATVQPVPLHPPRGPEERGGDAQAASKNLLERILDRLDAFQRVHRPIAFAFAVTKKFGDDGGGRLAALVAYYGFLSLFPLLLVLVTTLGFILRGNPELQQQVVDSALAQFPIVGEELESNVDRLDGNLVALAVGLAGALWGGLGAMQAAQYAMNGVWDIPLRDRPGFFAKRLRSLLMLVVLGGGILATTVVANLATYGPAQSFAVRALVFVVGSIVNTAIFLVAFRVLTDADLAWRTLFPGAVVAGTGWTVLQLAGGYIVARTLTRASETYGTFAVVLGLVSWLYLQAQLTLFAAEVNVVRHRRLWPRSLTGRNLTDADRRALAAYSKVEQRVAGQRIETDLSHL